MPNEAETIERLARESKRHKLMIQQLEQQNAELLKEIDALESQLNEQAKQE